MAVNGFAQPRIVLQPIDQFVDLGGAVTCLPAVGFSTLPTTLPTFQWQFNGADLPGATKDRLVLNDFQPDHVGGYSLIVMHATGNATSRVARLEINYPAPHVFNSIQSKAEGALAIQLGGNPSGRLRKFFDLYPIDVSTDLQEWKPLTTLLRTNASASGLTYLDADGKSSHRFYQTPTNHFPTPFPIPTGPHAVGTVSRLLTDPSRSNRYNIPTNSSFMITLWYPARLRAGDRPARLFDPPLAQDAAIWRNYGFTTLETVMPDLVGHARLTPELVRMNPLSPVVIVCPGYTDIRGDHAAKMELLASHGYIGVAIDHAHAYATVFPDGRMLKSGATSSQLNSFFPSDLQDVQFVLEELTRMNEADPIFQRSMDLERVATMGGSFGGGVAGEIARIDARVKASVHLDAYYQAATTLLQAGMGKPLLYTYSTQAGGLQTLYNRATQDAYSLQIAGTRHGDFGDNGAWIDKGDEAGRRIGLALNACMLSFLDKYLKGQDDHLLDNPSARYPEVLKFLKK
jgi:predicted dienelactone hydrolase